MSDITTLIADMARAARDFLDALTPEQRQQATLSFADEQERRRWFYTPTPRSGVPLVALAPRQYQKVTRLLAVGLSAPGYNYVSTLMGLENVVDHIQGFPDRTYGNLPGTRLRDPGNYFVAVFGTPDAAGAWSWRIGGHHLSLHYTLCDGHIAATPAFFGAEPSRLSLPGGVLLRPLTAEEDLARELLSLLRPDQRERAVIAPVAPTDIVQTNRPRIEEGALPSIGGPGPGGERLRAELGLTPELDEMVRYSSTPKGLAASAMNAAQRDVFLRLVCVYFEHLADPIAAQYAALLEPERFDGTTFAWAGPLAFGAPHYYRIQNERLLIEYDCTQNGANHTHTAVRDPQGDFGDDLLARHQATDRARQGLE